MPCDLGDVSAVNNLVQTVAPDAIINCGASVDISKNSLARQVPVNCLAPGILATWASRHGALFVQTSTIVVHGVQVVRADHLAPVQPDTDYARSKSLAEELIKASGCRSTIIRIGGIFGISGPDHLGLNRTIRSAASGTVPTVKGDGAALRNYIHVRDAALALLDATQDELCGVFRLGGSEVLSMKEMLQKVCDVYLPGQSPIYKEGPTTTDQIVEPSPELRASRSFIESLQAET